MLGKQREYKQSLLDHSMSLVNLGRVLLIYQVIEPSSLEQEQAFLLALAVHDAGKEKMEFQEYLRNGGRSPGDTDVNLSREVASDIVGKLGWSLPDSVLDAAVSLHMKHRDSNGGNFFELLQDHTDSEWRTVAQWVQDIDRIASAKSPQAAKEAWNRSAALSKLRKVTYHSVRLRGVSTVFLHKAMRQAFEESGWGVLMYYPFGNLYVARTSNAKMPDYDDIQGKLKEQFLGSVERGATDKVKLMHGSIIATYFVKHDLFTLDDLKPLLQEAGNRINEQPGSKVPDETVLSYWNIRSVLLTTGDEKLAYKAGQKDPVKLRSAIPSDLHTKLVFSESDLVNKDELAQYLGEARKEMAIFKMFKSVMGEILDKHQLIHLEESYDGVFGKGAFSCLQVTGTLKPAVDMAMTVDFFWNLEAEEHGFQMVSKMRFVEKRMRRQKLIEILGHIAEVVFEKLDITRSTENFVQSMTEQVLQDIEFPILQTDIFQLAEQQLNATIQAKTNVNSPKDIPHICPLCNNAFEQGVQAISDFVNKSTAFSNRITAYSQTKYHICKSCYFERLLQQLLLGGKPGEFLCVVPPVHVSHLIDEQLSANIEAFERRIRNFTEEKGAVTKALSLSFENMLASNVQKIDDLTGTEFFADLFTYSKSEKRMKEERKELLEVLASLCDNDLDVGNAYAEESYGSFEELLDALLDGKHANEPYFEEVRLAIKAKSPVQVIYQTPNFVVFPTVIQGSQDSAVKNDGDSEAKFSYKQLFLACLFSEFLGMSVSVLHNLESLHLLVEGMTGRVYVPDHPRVRKEVMEAREQSSDATTPWLSEQEAVVWRKAIEGAILLKKSAEFPERDDISRILSFNLPGELIRRIESKKGNGYKLTFFEWEQIQKVQEVLA